MIMGFRLCLGVFVILISSPISNFIQGHLIKPAIPVPIQVPVHASGLHSGFGSTFQVLGCPSGYIMYTGMCGPFCYRFETRACASFTTARQVCARDGGDLLNVDSCYFDFFRNIAERGEGCDPDVWMGASSASPGVNYITVRGDSVPQDTVLWDFIEPTPGSGGGCVGTDADNKHALEDAPCNLDKQYFCQIFI